MKTRINYLFVVIVSFAYAFIHFQPGNFSLIWIADPFVAYQPFVYRQLIPILARALSFIMPLYVAVLLLVTASGAGFYHALRKLAGKFYQLSDRTEFVLMASVSVSLILFGACAATYDLATAFLFTLALYYLASNRREKYLLLFPLICLNRETALLLTVLCVIWDIAKNNKDPEFIGLQIFTWGSIQIILRSIFANNPGVGASNKFLYNIGRFTEDPTQTILHLTVTVVILLLVFRHWYTKPLFLQTAFMLFAPALVGAYLLIGEAFEVRVFWEIFPVLALLILPTLHSKGRL